MAAPILPYEITIIADTKRGTAIVENTTKVDTADPQKNRIIVDLDTNRRNTVDLGNMRSGYSDGDKIEIRVFGLDTGFGTHTVNTKKTTKRTITIKQTGTDYAGASISL